MIGKSRHLDPNGQAQGSPPRRGAFGQGCGILRHSPPPGSYQHIRYRPPSALADWVEHFWMESWALRGCAPQTRVVLPHPCVHLVFAPGRSRIYGVQLSRFVRELKGDDRILGIKFRAGAFYPFFHKPVSTIVNTSLPAQQVFPNAIPAEKSVLACCDDHAMVDAAAQFLIAHLPPRDPNVDIACKIVEEIANDRCVTRVEHVTARCGLQERTLQRLFHRYVGASPRWVIKRYRVYDVLNQLSAGIPVAWAALAQDMGYFDQSHFNNDFKRMVGCAPGEYLELR
ncbi:helix-turn-helix domain-containing protein [Rhodanobacter sp. MP7CTX1]|uniref:helix-turn-helix domain-containing protein n=1 Tax=Rhodanobacter sp. MP7CTX1 TaxID=2723084 RepID=UPI0031B808E4